MSIIALKWTALGDLWQILNLRASPRHYLTRRFLYTVAWATALTCFYTCTNKQTGYVLSLFCFASRECKTSLLSARQPLLMEASACIVKMDFEFAPSASPLELRRFINAFCFNHLLSASHLSLFFFFSLFFFSPGAANGLRGGGSVFRSSGGRLLQADGGRTPLPVHGGGPRLGGAQHQQQLPRTHLVGSDARHLFSSPLKNLLKPEMTHLRDLHSLNWMWCNNQNSGLLILVRLLPVHATCDYLVMVFV